MIGAAAVLLDHGDNLSWLVTRVALGMTARDQEAIVVSGGEVNFPRKWRTVPCAQGCLSPPPSYRHQRHFLMSKDAAGTSCGVDIL